MLNRHSGLLSLFPALLLNKQEIVNIFLLVIEQLWDLRAGVADGESCARLDELAVRGKLAATQRANAIFYAQMVLVDAISARRTGDIGRASVSALAVGASLRSANLGIGHEGIKILARYLYHREPGLFRLLETSCRIGPVGVHQLIDRSDADDLGLRRELLAHVLMRYDKLDAAVCGIGDIVDLSSEIATD